MTGEAPSAASKRSLWRDRDFVAFCLGQGVSMMGTQFTVVALPLLATQTLHADGTGLGLVQGSVYAAYLVVPLLAGALVDRRAKRPLMIMCDSVRFLLVLSVPLLAWADMLNLALLCLIALVTGCCTVIFEVAHMAYVPALVSRDRLAEANSWTTSTEGAADLFGPAAAGLVVQATKSPPVALVVDAFSYLLSVFSLLTIRRREPEPEPAGDRTVLADIGEGLRYVAKERTIRSLAIQGFFFNGGSFAFLVAFLLHATQTQEAGAGWYGASLTAAGLGAFLGATQVPKLIERYGERRVFAVSVVGSAVLFVIVPAASGSAVTMGVMWLVGFFLANIAVSMCNVLSYTLRQRVTPDNLLGRMSASVRLVLFASIPVGSLAGGLISDSFGPRVALFSAVAIMALSIVPLRAILPACRTT
ncbi:MFS transporter [Nonomuraea guangzhouensis]|uniref:MFS transporter n=1 Tax=Nonomuraea guangzhouensis TaxID=1291555 RepID=A0ABW4GXR8_9ACTN|nr:MFS transporter [Nonomuraea guangzhouensis]